MDFAREAAMRHDDFEKNYWLDAAQKRKETINRLMYDSKTGLFHDYDYVNGAWGPVASVASYVTMWAGMVEPGSQQAHEMVGALDRFERLGGLAVTETFFMPLWERRKLQWAFPNAWSPITIMATDGLERAGFPDVARRLALKSLKTKVDYFNDNGVILEAYNALFPAQMPLPGMYPRQIGFGWTDAEIEYYSVRYVEGRHLPFIALQTTVDFGK
jgi:alpha,alpha-trehalase